VQVSQRELDQNLEIIYTQQSELHHLLQALESDLDTTITNQMDLSPTDIEREKGFVRSLLRVPTGVTRVNDYLLPHVFL
jgi:hypothetical protein